MPVAPAPRRFVAVLLAVVVLLGVAVAAWLPTTRATAQDDAPAVHPTSNAAWHTVYAGGQPRRYLLATPQATGAHPLVVALHGLNQTTDGFLQATGLLRAALAAGVGVLAPETPDRSWNDGRFGAAGRDDDAFISSVVDELVAHGVVDPDRIALAGFSNGAGMSVELLDKHPRRFAGALLVGGEVLAAPGTPRPHLPVATVMVHGDRDPIQPWSGRGRVGTRMPAQAGMPATLAAFLQADHAGSATPRQAMPHVTAGLPVVEQHWSGAGDVSMYEVVGGGHVWPVSACPVGGCDARRTFVRLADVSATELAVQLALTAQLADA